MADRFPGSAPSLARFPKDSLTVIVLTNADGARPYSVAESVARIYLAAVGKQAVGQQHYSLAEGNGQQATAPYGRSHPPPMASLLERVQRPDLHRCTRPRAAQLAHMA